jgi:hypothetical protein
MSVIYTTTQQENMSITLNLRYQKQDDYGSQIFIVSPKYEQEKIGYGKLCVIAEKLKSLNFDTFLPVYSNEDRKYATIRFKFYKGMKLNERNLYTVTFNAKQTEREEKTYINCMINTIKLHTKAPETDYGKTIDLNLF